MMDKMLINLHIVAGMMSGKFAPLWNLYRDSQRKKGNSPEIEVQPLWINAQCQDKGHYP